MHAMLASQGSIDLLTIRHALAQQVLTSCLQLKHALTVGRAARPALMVLPVTPARPDIPRMPLTTLAFVTQPSTSLTQLALVSAWILTTSAGIFVLTALSNALLAELLMTAPPARET